MPALRSSICASSAERRFPKVRITTRLSDIVRLWFECLPARPVWAFLDACICKRLAQNNLDPSGTRVDSVDSFRPLRWSCGHHNPWRDLEMKSGIVATSLLVIGLVAAPAHSQVFTPTFLAPRPAAD